MTSDNFTYRDMLPRWQYAALVFMFIGSAQSGLLMIANATPILNSTAHDLPFFVANAWLLSSFGGLVNATGRIGTGTYSDFIGRRNAYSLNAIAAILATILTPTIIEAQNIPLLFLVVGIVYWQYGGSSSLMPSFTADYFGSKNLGMNYGFIFIGWGISFFVPLLGAILQESTGRKDLPFYISAVLLALAVLIGRLIKPPKLHR